MNKSFDFLAAVARNYYMDSMSQSEIAKKYNLSRPTIANILKECREKGIVEIRINDNSPFSSPVSQRLMGLYKLNTICVVPNETDYPLTLYQTCLHAARFISTLLVDRIRIGISWGTALYHTIRQVPKSDIVDGEVVPLMGGLGASALFYDGSELARILADKLNGRSFPFLSPLLVKTVQLKQLLLSEPGIRETVEKTKNLDLALIGLSSDQPEDSSTVHAGFLSSSQARQIYNEGSCGHLCGYHYDKQGKFMDIPINQRVVGIDTSSFLQIPRRIAVACGRQKSKAILAALRGELITDLFTDELTALQMLSICE
ncbi:MAG: winged helix-turn-helix transcriptional regulator [Treponema sp.]|jgi:DNA-binding transcriptional regulator LsrR (DeoR family)|nr:winged helix-turn-helix transcriptional regulator [Treponema sp.]